MEIIRLPEYRNVFGFCRFLQDLSENWKLIQNVRLIDLLI